MADEVKPLDPNTVAHRDAPHAPVIFFDEAPIYANNKGVIAVTLEFLSAAPDGKGGITHELVVAGYLRCSTHAARALYNALDKALLIGAPVEGQPN